MKIIKFREAGSNNTLRWAINKELPVNTPEMMALINTETYYICTLSDVNQLELFRLVQIFRNKLHIIVEELAIIPSDESLKEIYSDSIKVVINDQEIPLWEYVKSTIEIFMNLTKQMQADSDIIGPNMIKLFLPMITRKFEVEIPISFQDLITAMDPLDLNVLFTPEYPENLESFIFDENNVSVRQFITQLFLKSTTILRYNEKYSDILKKIKYAPLNKIETTDMYRLKIASFSKYDKISREEISCQMFNVNKNELQQKMKRMSFINSNGNSLKLKMLVEMTIDQMIYLLNDFNDVDLPVSYEIPMKLIVDSVDYILDHIDQIFTTQEELSEEETETFNNTLKAYKVRITEAFTFLLQALQTLIDSTTENVFTNITDIFSIIPSIFMTRATITFDMANSQKYLDTHHWGEVALAKDVIQIADDIDKEINDSRKL